MVRGPDRHVSQRQGHRAGRPPAARRHPRPVRAGQCERSARRGRPGLLRRQPDRQPAHPQLADTARGTRSSTSIDPHGLGGITRRRSRLSPMPNWASPHCSPRSPTRRLSSARPGWPTRELAAAGGPRYRAARGTDPLRPDGLPTNSAGCCRTRTGRRGHGPRRHVDGRALDLAAGQGFIRRRAHSAGACPQRSALKSAAPTTGWCCSPAMAGCCHLSELETAAAGRCR